MEDMKEKVIAYFHSNRENTISKIAQVFNLPYWKVNKIIDNHLREKMKKNEPNKNMQHS